MSAPRRAAGAVPRPSAGPEVAGTPDDVRVLTPGEAFETARSLARAATSGSAHEHARWAAWLGRRSGREWLLLDDEARSWRRTGEAPVSGGLGGEGTSWHEPSGLVAVVTSWHVDGRVRQRGTRVLAARGGALAAAALAVRSLDHVTQVRVDALAGLDARTATDEAVAVFGVLAAGARRRFAAQALAEYSTGLSLRRDLAGLLAELRVAEEPRLRRWAFLHSCAHGLLGVEELFRTALSGGDQLLRAAAAGALWGRASPGQLLDLLGGRYVDGRLLALHELPDEALADGLLLPLLADRSGRVRELAQWRARKRGHDLPGWYRDRLRAPDCGPVCVAACLDGLSSCGAGEDAELAASLLAHGSPTVRVQAVLAVGSLAPGDVARRRLLPRLEDPAPRVSAAAARVLSRVGAGAVEAGSAWGSALPAARRAAWRLSRAAGTWERVDADVRAAADPDPVLAGLGRAGLRNWLHAGAATTWGRPAPAAAERLRAALPSAGLSDDEQRRILFHAGLPASRGPRSSVERPVRRPP